MTIYLFAGHFKKFPNQGYIQFFIRISFLPVFQIVFIPDFNLRLNRLSEAFRALSTRWVSSFIVADCDKGISLVDSLPVITCAGRNRQGKVALEITAKGYHSTKKKNMYYLQVETSYVNPAQGGDDPLSEILDGHSLPKIMIRWFLNRLRVIISPIP